jgi:type II secretory pathway pseudopilin PulG
MRLRSFPPARALRAFTLAEVVICIAIIVIAFSAIIGGYISSANRAEWSCYSLAAQAQAIQQLEQARSAMWDPTTIPPKDEFGNLNTNSFALMDLPITGTNGIYVTNSATISTLTIPGTIPTVSIRMVQVQTVWPYVRRGVRIYFTNTIVNYFAPDA